MSDLNGEKQRECERGFRKAEGRKLLAPAILRDFPTPDTTISDPASQAGICHGILIKSQIRQHCFSSQNRGRSKVP